MSGPVDGTTMGLLALFSILGAVGVLGLILAVVTSRRLDRLQFEMRREQREGDERRQRRAVPCPVCGAAHGQSCTNMLFGGRLDVPPQPHKERGPQ